MRKVYVALVSLCIASPWALAQEKHDHSTMSGPVKSTARPALKQKTCPVTGKPIREDVFVEHDGLKVYFCCPGCPAKFKESPEKYLPAVYRQVYPQAVQVQCPVSGAPIDPTAFTDFKGERIYFCCGDCAKQFAAEPAKYLAKMKDVSTGQVHCPVTGRAIDPRVSTEYQGKTVYFASKEALASFKADPSKYAIKLRPEVGVLACSPAAADDLVLCAVAPSDKAVHKRGDVQSTVYQGKTYFLFGAEDMKAFKGDPAKYARLLHAEMNARQQPNPEQWFTCSMHPDILQKGPGKCPKCGMDLIPIKGTGAKNEHMGHGMM